MLYKDNSIRIEENKKVTIFIFLCLCGKEIRVRSSRLKTHKGFCRSCSKLKAYDKDRKLCRICFEELPLSNFIVNSKGRPRYCCKECDSKKSLKWIQDNKDRRSEYLKNRWKNSRQELSTRNKLWRQQFPEKARDSMLRSHYGISLDKYLEQFSKQEGLCAICGKAETRTLKGALCWLSVDHDHLCCPGYKSCGGCIRGLLCSRCNTALGFLDDDTERIRKLQEYVHQFKQNRVSS